jgi:hypothetical protein
MKVCFVKKPNYTDWGWESYKYSNPEEVMGSWKLCSHDISLAVGKKADMWVIGRGAEWDSIPWGDYDIVITAGAIASPELMARHPKTLWICAGTSGKNYDLYWDHRLRATSELNELPQGIGFPYFTSPDVMRGFVIPAEANHRNPKHFVENRVVFIDSRHMFAIPRGHRHRDAHEYHHMCGLRVWHAPLNTVEKPGDNRAEFVAKNMMIHGKAYLEHVGACKYSVTWQKGAILGQGAAEAAALGLIVIANSNGIYHKMVCHPTCLVPPGCSPRKVFNLVNKIEKDPSWREEILAHQDKVLREKFWNEPLAILEKALGMKRK